MKKMKKLMIAGAALLLAVTIAGCSGDKTVASTTAGKIKQEELYNKMKGKYGEATLRQMLISAALEEQYGDKVSKKDGESEFNKTKKQLGDQFAAALQQNNVTESDFKETSRTRALIKVAVTDQKKFKDADYKKAFKTWVPKMSAQQIVVADEDKAKEVIAKLDAGEDFTKLVKEYSTDTTTKDKEGKIENFDNSTGLDATLVEAASKLKDGEYTKEAVQGQTGYAILKMTKNPGKGKWEDHKKELKEQMIDEIANDQAQLQPILAKIIKKANVQIEDKDMKNAVASILEPTTNTTSTK